MSIAVAPISFADDQPFFTKMALAVAILIVFGFVQFSLRGMVDWRTVPPKVHIHGIAMLAWLGVFVTQNWLAQRGDFALHRRLGRVSAILVAFLVVLGCAVGITALRIHAVPPFFTNAYFLALTQVEAVVFGGVVAAAILRRDDVQWHRRLMLGATIFVTEPALGRLLPMPFLGAWGGWLEVVFQLAIAAVLIAHDRRVLGRVHAATLTVIAVLVGGHAVIEALAVNDSVSMLAERIASGS